MFRPNPDTMQGKYYFYPAREEWYRLTRWHQENHAWDTVDLTGKPKVIRSTVNPHLLFDKPYTSARSVAEVKLCAYYDEEAQ